MDTYPRLAEGLDLAWTPDRSRIVAYNTSSGNVVATLTVKEGLFLSQLDGDVDPDDVGDFTQRERFRVLAKFASRGLLENDEKFEVSTKGLGTVTLSIPTPALSKTKSSVGLCLYYLAVRYLWVPLAVVCGIIGYPTFSGGFILIDSTAVTPERSGCCFLCPPTCRDVRAGYNRNCTTDTMQDYDSQAVR